MGVSSGSSEASSEESVSNSLELSMGVSSGSSEASSEITDTLIEALISGCNRTPISNSPNSLIGSLILMNFRSISRLDILDNSVAIKPVFTDPYNLPLAPERISIEISEPLIASANSCMSLIILTRSVSAFSTKLLTLNNAS